MYQVDEHATLSQPATFSLASIFSQCGLGDDAHCKPATEDLGG